MNSLYSTRFSKATLTGLFAGIVTTLLCIGYYIYYKETSGFPLSSIINISSMIFFVNLVFVIIGMVYYGFIKAFKKGEIVFIIVFLLLTGFLAMESGHVHRSDDPVLNAGFHHLLLALVIIMGAMSSLGIPFLFHNKEFEKHVVE